MPDILKQVGPQQYQFLKSLTDLTGGKNDAKAESDDDDVPELVGTFDDHAKWAFWAWTNGRVGWAFHSFQDEYIYPKCIHNSKHWTKQLETLKFADDWIVPWAWAVGSETAFWTIFLTNVCL